MNAEPMLDVARELAAATTGDLTQAIAAIEAATLHGDPDPLGNLVGFEAADEWRDPTTGRYCAACLGPALDRHIERVMDE